MGVACVRGVPPPAPAARRLPALPFWRRRPCGRAGAAAAVGRGARTSHAAHGGGWTAWRGRVEAWWARAPPIGAPPPLATRRAPGCRPDRAGEHGCWREREREGRGRVSVALYPPPSSSTAPRHERVHQRPRRVGRRRAFERAREAGGLAARAVDGEQGGHPRQAPRGPQGVGRVFPRRPVADLGGGGAVGGGRAPPRGAPHRETSPPPPPLVAPPRPPAATPPPRPPRPAPPAPRARRRGTRARRRAPRRATR